MTGEPVGAYFKWFELSQTTADISVVDILESPYIITSELKKVNISYMMDREKAKSSYTLKEIFSYMFFFTRGGWQKVQRHVGGI